MSQREIPEIEAGPSPDSSDRARSSRERRAAGGLAVRLRRGARALSKATVWSPRSRVDLARRLVPPLLLALVPLFWVVDATHRATLTTIGRDQGIFHYIAWAVRNGAVDYRDVRDVNGPLVHLIHVVLLLLGGGDEHRFHVLDLAATGASFAIVGALLPGALGRRTRWSERIVWAGATWVVLSAQYALYLYWNQAQRESFSDWFLLPSIALQIARPAPRTAFRRVVVVVGLSTLAFYGKSTFALFTAMQVGVLFFDRELALSTKQRLAAIALGGVAGSLVPLLFLLLHGDVASYLTITFRDVPQIYRYIWARSAQEILGDEGPLVTTAVALAVSGTLAALVALGTLPRRMLALALAPVVGVLTIVAQHKGFGYHFHPVTATTHIGLLVVLVTLWERLRSAPRRRPLGRLVALGATAAYALWITGAMASSPHIRNVWILAGGETSEKRREREYFDSFKSHDFFPWELRQAARYLVDNTAEDARVQMYGMDPYLLFLARRRSATPYIYAYDLNADAALDGGWSVQPTWLESERIKAWRAAHETDLLARLRASPPEAFVFVDRAPLITWPDAWEDFKHCCKESALWVATHYHAARSFGEVHVWLRDDLPVPDAEGLP